MDIMFLVVILVAVLGIMFIAKLSHMKHKISVISVIVLCLFLYLSFVGVAHTNSIKISSFTEFFTAGKLYFSWLGHVFDNMRTITGNVVRMDWMTNSTG
jgi:purine-cytosine permease-like protein